MLLKVALSTINLNQNLICIYKGNYRSDLDTILTEILFIHFGSCIHWLTVESNGKFLWFFLN